MSGRGGFSPHNVILNAYLSNKGKALDQGSDLSQVIASSGVSIPETVPGLKIEVTRVFFAPGEAVPDIVDLMPAGVQSVGQVVYRISNLSDKPHGLGIQSNSGASSTASIGADGTLDLDSVYGAGFDIGAELSPKAGITLQPGETILAGVWFGLNVPVSQPGEKLTASQTFVVDGAPAVSNFDVAVSQGYAAFPVLVEAQPAQAIAPPAGKSCQSNTDQIQPILQAAIPKQFWGLVYHTNGSYPPTMDIYGVTTGEASTLAVEGGRLGESEIMDLARMYFLHTDGSLGTLWTVPGITSLTGPGSTQTYFSFYKQGWQTSQEAQAIFSKPGQVFVVDYADWYIYPDGIKWDQCYEQGKYTPTLMCDLGLLLDPGESAQFFSTGVPAAGWFAVGGATIPNSVNAYRFPFPNAVTLPETTCP